jgi:hypothetical protein
LQKEEKAMKKILKSYFTPVGPLPEDEKRKFLADKIFREETARRNREAEEKSVVISSVFDFMKAVADPSNSASPAEEPNSLSARVRKQEQEQQEQEEREERERRQKEEMMSDDEEEEEPADEFLYQRLNLVKKTKLPKKKKYMTKVFNFIRGSTLHSSLILASLFLSCRAHLVFCSLGLFSFFFASSVAQLLFGFGV